MNASKTVFLHVGNFKTGTSAIQKYCNDNRELLVEKGLDYIDVARPSANETNHGQLALSLYQMAGQKTPDWYADEVSYEAVALQVKASIMSSTCQRVLISSEEFYRIPSFDDASKKLARNQLRDLFRGNEVKVILYVRSPMEFVMSWYNEVNKSRTPRRRFVDYVYYMDKRMVLPCSNLAFWRDVFGSNAVIVEPYSLTGLQHIRRFLSLASVDGLELGQSAALNINSRVDEQKLEEDRINKIMTIVKSDEREGYLRSTALSSIDRLKALEQKLNSINVEFERTCWEEGLEVRGSELSLFNVLVYDETINRRDVISTGGFGKVRAKLLNYKAAIWAKNGIHRLKRREKYK